MKNSRLPLSTLLAALALVSLGIVGFVAVVNKVTFQPQPVYTGLSSQKVLMLYGGADDASQQLYGQVTAALDYAEIAHAGADLAGGEQTPSWEEYTALVIAAQDLSSIGAEMALEIKEYVAAGGGLAVLAPARHPGLDELFGISGQEVGGEAIVSSGIHFVGDFIPGLGGLLVEGRDVGEFRSLAVATVDGVEILATTGDGSRPLVWRHQFGLGRVIYWNNDLLASKPFRGLAVQSVMAAHGGAVMALANAGIFHVDGFPAPPPAEAEDFYYRQWFPDMIELSAKYGVKYTWLADLRAEPPWDFGAWDEPSVEIEGHEVPFCAYMAHQAGRGGHELALQGYSQEAAFEAVGRRWQEDSLGPLPTTCALPDALYDEASLAALRAALPSARAVGADPFGAFEEGGDREFGPEPWSEELFAVPRWTNGYAGDPYTRLLALSELNAFGVWSHAVSAGDVSSWDEKHAQLDQLLNWNQEHHPWLRWLTTSDARSELLDYLATDATCTFDKSYQVTVQFSDHPTYLLLRLNDGRKLDMNSIVNAQIVSYYEGQGYYQYVLRATDLEVRLGLLIPAADL